MSPRHPDKPHVIILGGGLAGISAACRLLEDEYRVILVEKRPYLGGRTFSFDHHPLGKDGAGLQGSLAHSELHSDSAAASRRAAYSCQVDNGQHIFLGCCTHYIDLLRKLGTYSDTYMQRKFHVEIRKGGGPDRPPKVGALSAAPFLPAPFHILPSFLMYSHLGMVDKLRATFGLLCVAFARRHRRQLEQQSFYQWLKARGQTDESINAFWDLIILPTLNDDSRNVSAAMALMVYQEGVLKCYDSTNIGYSKVGLSELMGKPAQDRILAQGGNLLMGKQITRIIVEDDDDGPSKKVTGVMLAGGEMVHGDAYISALPFGDLAAVLPPNLADTSFFKGTKEMVVGPIVNVHIWYDRPVMNTKDDPFVAFVDSPLQWVFDKSRMLGADRTDDPGQYICVSISGAWDYVDLPKAAIREIVLNEMESAFPDAAEAGSRGTVGIKSPATFRCTPGSAELRPPARTPVKNLFLAGDWTNTGWPSTMEGAVRSGTAAAAAVSSEVQAG